MSNGPRPPQKKPTTSESQRQQTHSNHAKTTTTSSISNTPPQRQTTFLTHDSGSRAPSAYHVALKGGDIGDSQRARQEHGHGPTLTSPKSSVHAFTDTKQQQRAVTNLTKKDAQKLGGDTQMALRMQMLDGLAKTKATHGAQHLEAFDKPPTRANPHRSGGTVTFAQSGSQLANFDKVAQNTVALKGGDKTTQPIRDATTTNSSSATQFNAANMKAQREFAAKVLKKK